MTAHRSARQVRRTLLLVAASAMLTACGNNGTTTPEPPAEISFNLDAAFRDLYRRGDAANLRGEGNCLGTWVRVQRPATASDAPDALSALAAASSDTRLLAQSCPIASGLQTGLAYFDASYSPIGYVGSDGVAIFTEPFQLPQTARAGDLGEAGALTFYADTTRRQTLGEARLAYRVEAGSGSEEAIVEIVRSRTSAAGSAATVQRDRYRLTADGRLQLESSEIDGVTFMK